MQLFRLILPVVGAIAASLIAISAITVLLTSRLDKSSSEAELRLLADVVGKIPDNIRVIAEDNTWWNFAVEKVHLNEDVNWIAESYGGTAEGTNVIDGSIVFRPDFTVIHAFDSNNTPISPFDFLNNGLREKIEDLIPTDDDTGLSTAGYLTSNGRLFALGIGMIQPTNSSVFNPPLSNGRRPVLVYYQELTDARIAAIGTDIGLSDLTLTTDTDTPQADSVSSSMLISGLTDIPVARLDWTADSPGASLLSSILWPAIFFVGVIVLSLLIFIGRARQLVNELEQADRTKMAFLASMSHEVRTPLNAIIGFAEIVRMELHGEIKDAKNKEYLDIIRSSGEHLLTVINDILNISKLDADKMEVFAEAMDPVEIIEESIHMVENTAGDRSIRLVKELESSMIISDERIIRQILINLLSNAIKFTEPGGQVSVRSEIMESGYKIVVSDTGIGMSKDEIDVALAPFGQVHKGQKSIGGTGLGLPLVNRFLKLIGGTLTIRSAPGHGTSATIELPESVAAASDNMGAGQQVF